MMFTLEDFAHGLDAIAEDALSEAGVVGAFALGVSGMPDTPRAWLVFKNDAASASRELVSTGALGNPPTELGVDIALLAPVKVWNQFGADGLEGILALAASGKFEVAGNLAFFIRHTRFFVEALELVSARVYRRSNPQQLAEPI